MSHTIWFFLDEAAQHAAWFNPLRAALAAWDYAAEMVTEDELAPTSSAPALSLVVCLGGAEAGTRWLALNQWCGAANWPLVWLGQVGSAWQVGPGVKFGRTPCLACYNHQSLFFLAAAPAPVTPISLSAALAERSARSLAEFLSPAGRDWLSQGYALRYGAPPVTDRQLFRILKNHRCEVCSTWSRHAQEATYTA